MTEPITALLVSILGVFAFWALFRPVKGLFWRWQRAFRYTERMLIEDALKHLHDCEYNKLPCTLQSLGGALSISGDQAARLADHLQSLELIQSGGKELQLSEDGRSYALRIIRVHRRWERHLADRTGIPEPEWHQSAEDQEHRLSIQEADHLASQMGYPRFDPHGDPIPTASGELPPLKGIPLNELPEGAFGEIVHVEDEPAAVYAQLVALGIYPGMRVQMLDVAPQRISFAVEGEEILLAPLFAANINVQPFSEMLPAPGAQATLAQLRPGEIGRVTGISKACRAYQRRRLMDLGIIPGTMITAELRSAAGDPVAYRIRGAVIALRKEQSSLVYIARGNDESH